MEGLYYDIFMDNDSNTSNDTEFNMTGGPTCLFGLEPCSISILGNIQLVVFYGIILGVSAKIISDGAEMLLDLGLPPAIIGGIVLPLLGAVPDSAMIVASGLGDRESADTQIAVGMGTLAGSTIMLLTIPWFGGLILGRVDIIRNVGRDGKCSKFKLSSLWKQGVTVTPDVTYSSIVMLITALPYLIVQGADWYFGPSKAMKLNGIPSYIKDTAITTSVISFVFFIAYLVYLVVYNVASNRRNELRRQEKIKREVVKRFLLNMQRATTVQAAVQGGKEDTITADDGTGEKEPLLEKKGLQKRYFNAWKVHKNFSDETEAADEPEDEEKKETEVKTDNSSPPQIEEEHEDPKWKIAIKSLVYLTVGVGLVTIFSDPMVGALTNLVNPDNKNYFYYKDGHRVRGQYIPIPVFYLSFIITPICSNASELVSSLLFAAKKKRINSSMTFSQLYGAATMNNTLCLGIFAALVGLRGLTWQYSAEVTVILLIQIVMGIVALLSGFLNHHTYWLLLAFPVVFLYFFSILLVWMLENLLHWK